MDHTADNLLKYDINREQSMLFGTGFALVQIFKPARRVSLGLAISNDHRPGERNLAQKTIVNNPYYGTLQHPSLKHDSDSGFMGNCVIIRLSLLKQSLRLGQLDIVL